MGTAIKAVVVEVEVVVELEVEVLVLLVLVLEVEVVVVVGNDTDQRWTVPSHTAANRLFPERSR